MPTRASVLVNVGSNALPARAAASLAFVNNRVVHQDPLPADLAQRGVIFDTLQNALLRHGDLVKTHLLAQPPKLGSGKFAALHEAFLEDGAFVYVPKGVELADVLAVHHQADGQRNRAMVAPGADSRARPGVRQQSGLPLRVRTGEEIGGQNQEWRRRQDRQNGANHAQRDRQQAEDAVDRLFHAIFTSAPNSPAARKFPSAGR